MIFTPGEQKVRPGVYFRTTNLGAPPSPTVPSGIVAVLFKASWGPLGAVQPIDGGPEGLVAVYGEVGIARETFRGGAATVLARRLGSNGTAASVLLQDGAAVDVVKLELYPGERGNGFFATVRDSLADPTKRELILYEDTTKRQTVTFAKGSAEPDALVAALAGSPYIQTATKLAEGDGKLAAITQTPFLGGADPVPTAEDLSEALTAIEPEDWNVLVVDTADPAMHATIQTYINRVRADGKLVTAVLAEPTAVAVSARFAHARNLNDPAMVYVANGFKTGSGEAIEGTLAAGRVAGMIASGSITQSLTHAVVQGATGLVGALTNAQVVEAIDSGALVFTMSKRKLVQIEYGINTLVTLSADQDAGWKKIRRVRTRDSMMARIIAGWEPLIGRVSNDENGRATLIAVANGIIQQMINEGALLAGLCVEDPTYPPQGDSAWFRIGVDDLDSAERVYATFGFRFSPQ